VEVQLHILSTLTLDGGELSPSVPGAFLGERAPCSYWTGDWVGPRDGKDAVEKRNNFASAGGRTMIV
jgi:hypothetical protein